ncbi:S9 family peptidase [Microbacterium protaetiae]|uniref:S9 family peptidase n=1 Tax=Microbacterium protaetiae TaxID=2509458 RepID=A0A4P6EJP3_9MICO|nr:prolyl oligopeptidase family serine peptidase [Microbacterium protaetiae]QAY60327.1 S9 family peptidase [Microbacterium protaetiae]
MADPLNDDPHLWLEDIRDEKALAWARERTAETEAAYSDPALARRLRGILDDPDRIVVPSRHGEWMYDLWRDAANPRGLWRRASHTSFLTGTPEWQVLLDIDALGRDEGTPWAFAGAVHGPRGTQRALVQLSPDGGDAHVAREFDLAAARFVDDGFALAADKSHSAWLDPDTLLVGTALEGGAQTDSGYPRTARVWRRGTDLAAASPVIEAQPSDVAVFVGVDRTGDDVTAISSIAHDFFHQESFVWTADHPNPVRLAVPDDAYTNVHGDLIAVRTTTDWTVAGVAHPGGTLLVGPLATVTDGDGSELTAVFTPTATAVLEDWSWTKRRLVLTVLENVRSRIVSLDPADGWAQTDIDTGIESSDILTVDVVAADADEDDELWLFARGFLTPQTLIVTDAAAPAPSVVDQAPAVFDADGLVTTQHWAVSADGTRIPYFQIGRREIDGPAPVILSGYGGFEVSRLAEYATIQGPAWLEAGGVYVVANIRGGGEFGPAWHLAALRENRHRAYEDFVAVARDLVARQVTTAERIGCHGGSNGGLLVGNMLTQFPDDFGAVVCGVPLLDMRRYTRLSAGASWIAEYGDPDDPADWEFIRTFSPYHLIDPDRAYPPSLFYAATSDDRVGPVQARKMVARLTDETDAEVHYLEQDEGGHAASIDNGAKAALQATIHTFLTDALVRRVSPVRAAS